ncbi:uncharacterized protein LOC131634594 [Vicia villosa]|uniref:uncharacterized protein LOC131634594 n=1 Tax=Vicia villosa TaxID=3911 RepID=UPI00273C32F6|nr:uncharacterized protein LOC131634594 [Vicia villosa]
MTNKHYQGGEVNSGLMGWKLSIIGMWKLNTYGASKANKEAGCSGIVRDHNGDWRGSLSKYLGICSALHVHHGYKKGGIDKTLFVKEKDEKLMVAQIYVDDIVFGGMSDEMVQHFVKQMQSEFEM